MQKYVYMILLFQYTAVGICAQTKSDSLFVQSVDSIVQLRNSINYWGSGLLYKQIDDPTNYKTIYGRSKNGELVDIVQRNVAGGCETTIFHLVDNELVLVVYELADPDVQSEGPPSISYKLYYKDHAWVMRTTTQYRGGPSTCDYFSVEGKDFISELIYCKSLLLKD